MIFERSALVLALAAMTTVAPVSSAMAEVPVIRHGVVSQSWDLSAFETKNNIDMQCPAAAPFLINSSYALGRMLPPGVSVEEPGGVGVSAVASLSAENGRASGVQSLSSTNWSFGNATVRVVLHCTSSPEEGYVGSGSL